MTLILDAGALIALERDERAMWTRLKGSHASGVLPITPAGVVGQVFRGSPRQARLIVALRGIDVRPLDDRAARSIGLLLARAGSSDVIDASVVLLAADGDDIVTSDPDDIERLAEASGRHVELIHP